MVLPETDVIRVQWWSRARVPATFRSELRIEVDISPQHLTIVETRPPWSPDSGPGWARFPIARLRFTATTGLWSLYWRDRNLRFHSYDLAAASPDVGDLLTALDTDPTGIFWG